MAIASLLLTNTPDTLRLVLVDPKHVGFSELARSRFLLREDALILPPDLMADSASRRQLEDRVVRLGAKGRAARIHLILATQHPDAKTVFYSSGDRLWRLQAPYLSDKERSEIFQV